MLINKAETILKENDDLTFACINGDKLYSSTEKGISPVIDRLIEDKTFFDGASVADRIIGRAAAFLFIKGKVNMIYTEIISKYALDALKNSGIELKYDKVCDFIENRTGSGMCPMESAVLNESDAEKAYEILCIKYNELTQKV